MTDLLTVYADIRQLIEEYTIPDKDAIALMPFAACLDQLFMEKYEVDIP